MNFLKNIWPLTKGKPALLGLSPCHSGKDAVADGKSMNFTNGIQIHWLPVDRIQADLTERLISHSKNKFFCIPESYSLYKYISLILSWLWTFFLKKSEKS